MTSRELGAIDRQQVLQNVPQYLKENYRFVLVNRRKQPINEHGVGVEDWMNWGNQFTFGMAWTLWNDDATGIIAGIAVVLPVDGDVTCIDVDDIGQVKPEYLDLAKRVRMALWQTYNSVTYAEQSGSGLGGHIFVRASHFDHVGRTVLSRVNIQVYARNRIIVLTGNRNSATTDIVVDQDALRGIFVQLAIAAGLDPNTPLEYEQADDEYIQCGRSLELTDEQVLERAYKANREFAGWVETAWPPGVWSDINAKVVGDLDKITGSTAQIRRIILQLPYVTKSPPDKSNRSRTSKVERNLEYDLRKVRPGNDALWRERAAQREANRSFATAMIDGGMFGRTDPNSWAQQSQKDVVAFTPDPEPTDDAEPVIDETSSPNARALALIKTALPGTYNEMRRPPGVTAEFVDALGAMCTDPRLTYMLPTVLSTLAGYIAQTFKLDDMGPTLHFIVAGMSNTGKTTTIELFDESVQLALAGYHRSTTSPRALMREAKEAFVPSHHRMIATRASSVQGIYDKVQVLGAGTWFADEAEAQIRMMLDDRNSMGLPLKAFYKQAFGTSSTGKRASLDASRTNTKMGVVEINNMSLSTIFSCTSEVLQTISGKELEDGTMSRPIILYDETPMRAQVKNIRDCARGLPLRLARIMRRIAQVADDTANAYDQEGLLELRNDKSAEKGAYRKKLHANQLAGDALTLPVAMDADAADLLTRIQLEVRRIASIAQDLNRHDFPRHYHSFSRVELITPSIACILAVVDMMAKWCDDVVDPHETFQDKWRQSMPQVRVTREHMQWAFEYVALWRLRFLQAWDEGKVSTTLAADETAIKRIFEDLVRKGKAVDGKWVPANKLRDRARLVKPFIDADSMSNVGRTDAAAMVARTLKRMQDAKKIRVVDHTTIGQTRGDFYGWLEE